MSPFKKKNYADIDQLKPGLRCMTESPDVMTTTTSDMPGYKITQVLGAVFAIRYQPSGHFGIENSLYSRVNRAMSRLVAETRARGGNAIIRVRYEKTFSTNSFVHGTAVIVEKLPVIESADASSS